MIKTLSQVMLYIEDREKSVEFWTKTLDFVIKAQEELLDGYYFTEVAPYSQAETSIVIFDKAFIKEHSDVSNLDTPSLMFKTDDIDGLYEDFKKKGVTVGEKVTHPDETIFNFADDEGNYFAVSD